MVGLPVASTSSQIQEFAFLLRFVPSVTQIIYEELLITLGPLGVSSGICAIITRTKWDLSMN